MALLTLSLNVWSISNLSYGLRNIISYSMENVAFHSLLGREMLIPSNSHCPHRYTFFFLKSWPNGLLNSSKLEQTRAKFTTSMELGSVSPPTWYELARVGSNWLELIKLKFSPSSSQVNRLATSAKSSQLKPSCFVIVMWLRGGIQTIEWFLSSWLDSVESFGHPLMHVLIFVTWLELAQVGSTVWPGLKVGRMYSLGVGVNEGVNKLRMPLILDLITVVLIWQNLAAQA